MSSSSAIEQVVVSFSTSGICKNRLVAVMTLRELPSNAKSNDDISLIDDQHKKLATERVSAIREGLSGQLPRHMIPTIWVVLRSVPTLPSGKLNRKSIQNWIDNISKDVYCHIENLTANKTADIPGSTIERQFQMICSEILNRPAEEVHLGNSFLEIGGDSISAMSFVARCRKEGIAVGVQDLLRAKSLSQLALQSRAATKTMTTWDEVTETPFKLSPIQQMHFDIVPEGCNHYNQSFLLRLSRNIKASDLEGALQKLTRHHSMLRARFMKSTEGWVQMIAKNIEDSYRCDVHDIDSAQDIPSITAARQSSLDIQKGPVFAVDLFNMKEAEQQLFLVAHHLVIDLVSWRIVLQDLEEILSSGVLSSEKPLPFQTWCQLQSDYISKNVRPKSLLPFELASPDFGFWGMQDHANLVGETVHMSFNLDSDLTRLLLGAECHKALRTEPVDVMLSAIILSFCHVFRRPSPVIHSEGHGRESWDSDIDPSGTVGWFTTMCPIQVNADENSTVIEVLRQIKDVRRKISRNGWDYFTHQYHNSNSTRSAAIEMTFNYTGLYQQLERANSLFRPMQQVNIDDTGRTMPRDSLFDILVTPGNDSTMDFHFTFHRDILHQDRIQRWIRNCELSLRTTLDQLEQLEGRVTLTDFPLLPLKTYEELQTLVEDKLPAMGIMDVSQVEDIYPLSPVQQGMLLSQIRSASYYETYGVWEVKAPIPVNIEQLAAAWQHTVDYHASLRTVFVESACGDGLYDQVVLKTMQARLQICKCEENPDLLAVFSKRQPSDDQNSQATPEAQALHQVTLFHTNGGRTFFKLEISHAVTDGISMAIMLRDFCLAYDGLLPAGPGPLYSSYIAYTQNHPKEDSITYWNRHLANVNSCNFPKLASSEDDQDLRTIDVNFETSYSSMQSFCSTRGMTLSNVFQVAWALVLRSFVGSDQITFGYLTSGRDVPVIDVENAVGVFINMLVCCMDLSASISVQSALEKVQTDFINGLQHQHTSLAEIQHALGIPRTLFNTVMSVQRRDLGSASNTLFLEEVIGDDPTEASTNIIQNEI